MKSFAALSEGTSFADGHARCSICDLEALQRALQSESVGNDQSISG